MSRDSVFPKEEGSSTLDVHPPHKPIESWREFFVHLITITIGLLIALGLEGTVEWMHHLHLVREARTNIRQEIAGNQKQIQKNLLSIQQDEERMKKNLQLLTTVRETHSTPKGSSLDYILSWSSFNDSAWKTARDTGALDYMEYKSVQGFADLYSQQEIANSAAVSLFQEQVRAISPIYIYAGKGGPEKLNPTEMALILQRSADLLMDLQELEQVMTQLDQQYGKTLKEM
jgi:hypothetical protein